MSTDLSPLLLVGLSFLPADGEKQEQYSSYSALYLTGKVLDVFDNHQVLISLGTSHRVRKGMEMDVYRLGPEPCYVGRVELVDVGSKHAIGRFRENLGQPKQVRENDIASLVYKMPPIRELPRIPGWQQRGGAILDPEGLLKRK